MRRWLAITAATCGLAMAGPYAHAQPDSDMPQIEQYSGLRRTDFRPPAQAPSDGQSKPAKTLTDQAPTQPANPPKGVEIKTPAATVLINAQPAIESKAAPPQALPIIGAEALTDRVPNGQATAQLPALPIDPLPLNPAPPLPPVRDVTTEPPVAPAETFAPLPPLPSTPELPANTPTVPAIPMATKNQKREETPEREPAQAKPTEAAPNAPLLWPRDIWLQEMARGAAGAVPTLAVVGALLLLAWRVKPLIRVEHAGGTAAAISVADLAGLLRAAAPPAPGPSPGEPNLRQPQPQPQAPLKPLEPLDSDDDEPATTAHTFTLGPTFQEEQLQRERETQNEEAGLLQQLFEQNLKLHEDLKQGWDETPADMPAPDEVGEEAELAAAL